MNPRKKVDLKLIIVGALGVGKTSLLHQYVHKTFYEEYQTTLGASILSKIIMLDDTTLKLQYREILENHLTDSIKLVPGQAKSRCC
uniref:RAB7B, member RAS oncogene family n=3 Tax=Marmotini TaxID=337730 RepID=A0A8C9USI0_SPEDA